MAHSERQQNDFNQDPSKDQKSQLLSSEIDNLRTGIRVDFDQKLGELADLLARFKKMVVAPDTDTTAANDASINEDGGQNDSINTNDCQIDAKITNESQIANQTSESSHNTTDVRGAQPTESNSTETIEDTKKPSYFAETARFENGLYKLNCQLYRFRLELDQEMEFREEPLHVHFRQPSDLSAVLQKLSDRSSEKHSDN